jgi:hypothetical protein
MSLSFRINKNNCLQNSGVLRAFESLELVQEPRPALKVTTRTTVFITVSEHFVFLIVSKK